VCVSTRVNLDEARQRGRGMQAAGAAQHARNLLPILREVQAAGARTLAEIAAALNARGVPTARGGTWAAMTVKRVLDRAG
jgi:Recombinase